MLLYKARHAQAGLWAVSVAFVGELYTDCVNTYISTFFFLPGVHLFDKTLLFYPWSHLGLLCHLTSTAQSPRTRPKPSSKLLGSKTNVASKRRPTFDMDRRFPNRDLAGRRRTAKAWSMIVGCSCEEQFRYSTC